MVSSGQQASAESKRLGSYLPALPLAEWLLPILPQPKIDRFSKDRLQRRIAVVRQPIQCPKKPRIGIANNRPLPDPRLGAKRSKDWDLPRSPRPP